MSESKLDTQPHHLLFGIVQDALSQAKLDGSINQAQHIEDWQQLSDCPYIEYTPWMMDFHCEYLNFGDNHAQAFYIVLRSNGKAVGLLPIVVQNYPQNPTIGTNAGSLMPPFLLPDLSRKQQRRISANCLQFIEVLAKSLNIQQLRSSFIFTPGESETWYNLLLERGADGQFSQELFCALDYSDERYLQLIRDKYRSHIRKADKLWDIQVHSKVSDELFAQFEQFHIDVVGFRTRSHQTWLQLKNAVNAGQAFCVFAFDENQQLIGAALYSHTSIQAVYSVGVYDRSLFDKPISHGVHYKAINEMKARGLKAYHLGPRCHASEWMQPTDKEVQIGHFKEGFATDSLFRLTMNWQV